MKFDLKMKLLIYKNINTNFTYDNICKYLYEFWNRYIIISNNNKVWLTISVVKINDISLILIKNLPFNTYDYKDILIVLKQKFEDEMLNNKKEKLRSITFTYYFDDNNKDINYCYNIIYFLCVFLSIIVIYLHFNNYSDIIFDNIVIPSDIILDFNNINYLYNNSISTNQLNIFERFIELFKWDYPIKYFPSYFIKYNTIYINNNYISIYELLLTQHFIILDNVNNEALNYMHNYELLHIELFKYISQYSSTIKWIINNNSIKNNI